jgi:hypothetical protein
LGICYNNLSKPNPKLGNGLKRAVYFFGDVDERDEVIKVLYALRNGLVHNISLASKNPNKPNDNYYFRYSDEITGIYQAAINSWTGNYSDLDTEEHVTLISPKNLKVFVDKCISTANSLNNEDKLEIRLEGGCQELFYCYLRTIDV